MISEKQYKYFKSQIEKYELENPVVKEVDVVKEVVVVKDIKCFFKKNNVVKKVKSVEGSL